MLHSILLLTTKSFITCSNNLPPEIYTSGVRISSSFDSSLYLADFPSKGLRLVKNSSPNDVAFLKGKDLYFGTQKICGLSSNSNFCNSNFSGWSFFKDSNGFFSIQNSGKCLKIGSKLFDLGFETYEIVLDNCLNDCYSKFRIISKDNDDNNVRGRNEQVPLCYLNTNLNEQKSDSSGINMSKAVPMALKIALDQYETQKEAQQQQYTTNTTEPECSLNSNSNRSNNVLDDIESQIVPQNSSIQQSSPLNLCDVPKIPQQNVVVPVNTPKPTNTLIPQPQIQPQPVVYVNPPQPIYKQTVVVPPKSNTTKTLLYPPLPPLPQQNIVLPPQQPKPTTTTCEIQNINNNNNTPQPVQPQPKKRSVPVKVINIQPPQESTPIQQPAVPQQNVIVQPVVPQNVTVQEVNQDYQPTITCEVSKPTITTPQNYVQPPILPIIKQNTTTNYSTPSQNVNVVPQYVVQNENIPEQPQPEIQPVYVQPEIQPVYVQPEIQPVYVQPQPTQQPIQPEIQPIYIQPQQSQQPQQPQYEIVNVQPQQVVESCDVVPQQTFPNQSVVPSIEYTTTNNETFTDQVQPKISECNLVSSNLNLNSSPNPNLSLNQKSYMTPCEIQKMKEENDKKDVVYLNGKGYRMEVGEGKTEMSCDKCKSV